MLSHPGSQLLALVSVFDITLVWCLCKRCIPLLSVRESYRTPKINQLIHYREGENDLKKKSSPNRILLLVHFLACFMSAQEVL